jgi:hypothetical protein
MKKLDLVSSFSLSLSPVSLSAIHNSHNEREQRATSNEKTRDKK